MSNRIVEVIRRPLSDEDKGALDLHLSAARDDGERYQQAFQWLGLRRDADYRDRVIQLATLGACNTDGVEERELLGRSAELELDLDRWKLPKGQSALGRILTGMSMRARGPVLTTNFDPLTEIAVRKAGGSVNMFVNANDSSFLANLRVQNVPVVLHLHGFWRDSATLSTPEQLEMRRPALESSLRYILENYTLLVVGYGGWSDVVTTILQELVSRQEVDNLDVLWAFYERPEKVSELLGAFPVLSALAAAPGNVKFYAGVDANIFFPKLEQAIAQDLSYSELPREGAGRASLSGWATITPDFLSRQEYLATRESAITFLDGRMPSWHDAVSRYVPLREAAQELYLRLKQGIASRESSLDLLLGASGEGKSTIAKQFAVLAARDPEFNADILYLSGDYIGPEASLLQLSAQRSCVLVIDDAYRFMSRLQELVAQVKERGRLRFHLVLVARDTDWHNAGGTTFAWNSYMRYRKHPVRGITRSDAAVMVRTWERLGAVALGELATCDSSEERVATLYASAHGGGLILADGTLLGALLMTRYGAGLREHIAQLVHRLSSRLIRGSSSEDSLLDALVLIAFPYAYGILDLEPVVLCDTLGLEWPSLVLEVLEPLGDEAAITYTSGRVVVRHEAIASSIIDVCLEIDYDLERAVERLVGAAARRIARDGYAPRMGSIAYLAKEITDLPRLAIAAAGAAHAAVPSRLSYVTTMSSVLRKHDDAERARTVNAAAVSLMANSQNVEQARAFLTEWAVVEGNLGCWARNAMLAGLALQDSGSLGAVTLDKARFAASCLLLALTRMESRQHDDRLLSGMAAMLMVVRVIGDQPGRTWLREAERAMEAHGRSYSDLEEDVDIEVGIRSALSAARQRLEAPLPSLLPSFSGSFAGLMRCMWA